MSDLLMALRQAVAALPPAEPVAQSRVTDKRLLIDFLTRNPHLAGVDKGVFYVEPHVAIGFITMRADDVDKTLAAWGVDRRRTTSHRIIGESIQCFEIEQPRT